VYSHDERVDCICCDPQVFELCPWIVHVIAACPPKKQQLAKSCRPNSFEQCVDATCKTPSVYAGIPIKLMHEATGHVVTVELKSGEIYRGELVDAEDNWNCQLKDVTATGRDGRVAQLEHIFVRGRCVVAAI
jgi:small nuclear ribonucleoprotein (snRNP)-like protein